MTAQVILNGLVTGMVVALPAVALTLIYGILKFPNFAIGAMLTVGAYLALALNVYLSLPVLYAADSIDITRAFIQEYNSKNPATASAAAPGR